MKMTESVLRKIIAEEIAIAYEEGRLDEGFLDDIKSKFSGMTSKLFGKDTAKPSLSTRGLQGQSPEKAEMLIAKKRAMG